MKHTIVKSCLACASLLIFFQAAPVAGTALEVFLDDLDSFSADFEQVLLGPSGEALEASKGALRVRRPDMFYWLYDEPYTQKIISDGASLWVYEADLEQVTISAVSAALEDTPALLFSNAEALNEHYLVTEPENDGSNALVQLTPKNRESHYRSLRLIFSARELAGMVLLDSLGQTLVLTFTNSVRNPNLPTDYFTFTPADDTEVIDARPAE
ncbi:MAG: outer membrane lipoprotein chaperone LolA [Gammaproteobacteria bacterium]|nr:outer membrane lipoprotein chaperone LolA [Gammaproteobacteria bacterium]MCY4282329.1 outer membrane lipoprotein chaperone LolA [Gammaproteobacteria bacterium]MCY4338023.1 outer membrane lipoprotein chaperone LolA [Gammaproteobacteria bacterium]